MAGSDRWYFTKEYLLNTPSRKCGVDYDKELSYRQQSANLIQDMGQRLQVTQLCINTAIVYMHRFYMFHSFTKFHRNAIAACALFLAAKVEEQPRKLEHVIRVAHMCLHRETPSLDTHSEEYMDRSHDLVVNENIMLQTLGFDIAIEHPHTFVVKCCQLVRASKDLAQTSYFMATNSLHLTTMCLQYKPTVVACVCIHLACKWSSWEIPQSSEGKDWFFYVDKSVTAEILEELTSEFLAILDKCPSRLRRKTASGITSGPGSLPSLSNDVLARLAPVKDENKSSPLKNDSKSKSLSSSGQSAVNSKSSSEQLSHNSSASGLKRRSTSPLKQNKTKKETLPNSVKTSQSSANTLQVPGSSHSHSSMSYSAYKEKKEKEKLGSQVSHHSTTSTSSSQYSSHHQHSMHHHHHHHHHQSPNIINKDTSNRGYNKSLSSTSSSAPLKPSTSTSSYLISKDKAEQSLNQNQNRINQSSSSSSLHTSNLKEQKEINKEKERQMKERSKFKPKVQDHLWGENNKIMSTTNTSQEHSHSSTSNNNPATQSFFDNLMNKPASSVYNSNYDSSVSGSGVKPNWENLLSTDGEDSLELKKEIADLRMEFSDNDSNASNQFNLSSLPPLIMPGVSENSQEPKSTKASPLSTNCSFMSIFTSDAFDKHETNVVTESAKLNNSNCKDYSGALSSILEDKPKHPPPILSPLQPEPPSIVKSEKILSIECDKSTKPTKSPDSVLKGSSTNTIRNLTSSSSFTSSLSHQPAASSSPPIKQNLIKTKTESTNIVNKGISKSPKSKPSSTSLPLSSSTLQTQSSSSFASVLPSSPPKRLSPPTLPSYSLTMASSTFSTTQSKQELPKLTRSPPLSAPLPLPVTLVSTSVPPPPSSVAMPSNLSSLAPLLPSAAVAATTTTATTLTPTPIATTSSSTALTSLSTSSLLTSSLPPSLLPLSSLSASASLSSSASASLKSHSIHDSKSLLDEVEYDSKNSSVNKSKERSYFHSHSHHDHRHHKHDKHRKDKHKHKHKQKDKSKERLRDEDLEIKMTLSVPKDKRNQEDSSLNKSPIKLKISKKKLNLSDDVNESVTNEGSLPKSLRIVIPKERLSNTSTFVDNSSSHRNPSFSSSSSSSSSKKRKNSPKQYLDRDKRFRNDINEGNDYLNRKHGVNVTSFSSTLNSNQYSNLDTKYKTKDHVNDGKKIK